MRARCITSRRTFKAPRLADPRYLRSFRTRRSFRTYISPQRERPSIAQRSWCNSRPLPSDIRYRREISRRNINSSIFATSGVTLPRGVEEDGGNWRERRSRKGDIVAIFRRRGTGLAIARLRPRPGERSARINIAELSSRFRRDADLSVDSRSIWRNASFRSDTNRPAEFSKRRLGGRSRDRRSRGWSLAKAAATIGTIVIPLQIVAADCCSSFVIARRSRPRAGGNRRHSMRRTGKGARWCNEM